jgi:hypothetical protein
MGYVNQPAATAVAAVHCPGSYVVLLTDENGDVLVDDGGLELTDS